MRRSIAPTAQEILFLLFFTDVLHLWRNGWNAFLNKNFFVNFLNVDKAKSSAKFISVWPTPASINTAP